MGELVVEALIFTTAGSAPPPRYTDTIVNDSQEIPPRVHIVGRRNAGKTTLVCELVGELSRRGLRIATIKHTHHHHELDTPGKDSWKHRDAGAAAVGILSPHMIAAFVPCERSEADPNGYERLSGLLSNCDLLLVEGDLSATAFKLEVWHPEIAEPPYAQSDARIHVVISDVPMDVQQPVWPRSDVPEITDRILERIGIEFS